MQFQVPQFIDVEDKIIGFVTVRQFIYIVIAVFADVLLYSLLEPWLWVMMTLVLAAVVLVVAFLKYNGRPILEVLGRIFRYYWAPHFYLWGKQYTIIQPKTGQTPNAPSQKPLASPLGPVRGTPYVSGKALQAIRLRFLQSKKAG